MTSLAISLGINSVAVLNRSGGTPAPTPTPAPISAVASDGWQATMITPADLALSSVSVSRQGFDATGAAATIAETLLTTKRVRQPYPNQASLTASSVALSEYVYSTDTISGVTNSSAEISPKPVACWGLVDRTVVGNSLPLEVVAFHRNGRQGKPVACVVFRATDGTNTVQATVSTLAVSPETGDEQPVLVYRTTLDISTLSDNANITVNAKVYPWIGAAASVLDSADNAASPRTFSPRTYRKNTARAAAPYYVAVASGGDDVNGAVSNVSAATAEASPCLTLTGAINRARTVLGTSAGALDGLRVRMTEGTWSLSANPTANTVNAEIVIEPATGASKAGTIIQFGAANFNTGTGFLRYRGVTLSRQGAFYLGSSTSVVTVEDCSLDFNANTGALLSGAGSLQFVNTAFTGLAGTALSAGTPLIALLRGCTGGTANATHQIEFYRTLGCSFLGGRSNWGARDPSGALLAYNKFMSVGSATAGFFGITNSTIIDGAAIVQNVIEYTSATSNPAAAPSADSDAANTSHIIMWHNTLAGFNTHGRTNALYDETAADPRTHKLQSFVGNIHVSLNTKHDVFMSDGTRVGGWAYLNGVGCRGEFTRYKDAGTFGQDYPGLNASIGTGNTGAGNDPLFTTYAATTTAGAAGAGGGTYTIGALSPAKSRVADPVLPYDLAGSARASSNDAAGAYAA